MSEESSSCCESGKTFAVGLIVGAFVGAAVALLYAPKSGRETRAMVKEKAHEVAEKAKDAAEKAKDAAEKAKEAALNAEKRVEEKLRREKPAQ